MQTYLFWESCFWITETRISSWCMWFFCQLTQSRYSPLWTAFSDASQHILPCLCYLTKTFSAVLCKGMFLWDWQPWETKGPPACLPGELCPFLTTWPSLWHPPHGEDSAGQKQRLFLLDLKLDFPPRKSAWLPQPAGSGGVHEGVGEKVRVGTDSVPLSEMSKPSCACTESPPKTVGPITWVPAFCNVGLGKSFVLQAVEELVPRVHGTSFSWHSMHMNARIQMLNAQ